jgi:hypothetical protein
MHSLGSATALSRAQYFLAAGPSPIAFPNPDIGISGISWCGHAVRRSSVQPPSKLIRRSLSDKIKGRVID